MSGPSRGFRYAICPECARRRKVWDVHVYPRHYRWTCSQGHQWVVEASHQDLINEVSRSLFTPAVIESLLSPGPLLAYFKGAR